MGRRKNQLKSALGGDRASSGLEHAPGAWMQQLVRSLPYKDQWALFQTCKTLARCVLAHVPRVQFWVCQGDIKSSRGPTIQRFITHLLDVGRDLEIVQWNRGIRPFPTQLSHRVVNLTLSLGPDEGEPQDCFQWAALTNLRELAWCSCISERDVKRVCDALEAGHLKQLATLTFTNTSYHAIDHSLMNRLVTLLGRQITHLKSSICLYDERLSKFTVLQSVETGHEITRQMCEHPTLRTVTLRPLCNPYHIKDLSGVKCGFETLVLDGVRPTLLAALPLAGLKQIQVVGQLPTNRPFWGNDAEEWQALGDVLSRHGSKIVCKPITNAGLKRGTCPQYRTPTYCMHHLCEETILLVSKINEPCQLHLRGLVIKAMSEDVALMHALWHALPSVVHTIMWDVWNSWTPDWALLWKDLPRSVTTFLVYEGVVFDASALIKFARLVPGHISFAKADVKIPSRISWMAKLIHGLWGHYYPSS